MGYSQNDVADKGGFTLMTPKSQHVPTPLPPASDDQDIPDHSRQMISVIQTDRTDDGYHQLPREAEKNHYTTAANDVLLGGHEATAHPDSQTDQDFCSEKTENLPSSIPKHHFSDDDDESGDMMPPLKRMKCFSEKVGDVPPFLIREVSTTSNMPSSEVEDTFNYAMSGNESYALPKEDMNMGAECDSTTDQNISELATALQMGMFKTPGTLCNLTNQMVPNMSHMEIEDNGIALQNGCENVTDSVLLDSELIDDKRLAETHSSPCETNDLDEEDKNICTSTTQPDEATPASCTNQINAETIQVAANKKEENDVVVSVTDISDVKSTAAGTDSTSEDTHIGVSLPYVGKEEHSCFPEVSVGRCSDVTPMQDIACVAVENNGNGPNAVTEMLTTTEPSISFPKAVNMGTDCPYESDTPIIEACFQEEPEKSGNVQREDNVQDSSKKTLSVNNEEPENHSTITVQPDGSQVVGMEAGTDKNDHHEVSADLRDFALLDEATDLSLESTEVSSQQEDVTKINMNQEEHTRASTEKVVISILEEITYIVTQRSPATLVTQHSVPMLTSTDSGPSVTTDPECDTSTCNDIIHHLNELEGTDQTCLEDYANLNNMKCLPSNTNTCDATKETQLNTTSQLESYCMSMPISEDSNRKQNQIEDIDLVLPKLTITASPDNTCMPHDIALKSTPALEMAEDMLPMPSNEQEMQLPMQYEDVSVINSTFPMPQGPNNTQGVLNVHEGSQLTPAKEEVLASPGLVTASSLQEAKNISKNQSSTVEVLRDIEDLSDVDDSINSENQQENHKMQEFTIQTQAFMPGSHQYDEDIHLDLYIDHMVDSQLISERDHEQIVPVEKTPTPSDNSADKDERLLDALDLHGIRVHYKDAWTNTEERMEGTLQSAQLQQKDQAVPARNIVINHDDQESHTNSPDTGVTNLDSPHHSTSSGGQTDACNPLPRKEMSKNTFQWSTDLQPTVQEEEGSTASKLRLGLSRRVKLKPLHPGLKIKPY